MLSSTNTKYTFSGHESFPCKSLWLKKGYDFVQSGYDWNAPDAVVKLGVGKNMVSSIRYWMKSFGLLSDNELTNIAHYLLDTKHGADPFIEDLGTLWLLHYMLVSQGEASLYKLVFTRLQYERQSFDTKQVLSFVKRIMTEDGKFKIYNENTVKKDFNVLLQTYAYARRSSSVEEHSLLLTDLNIIRHFNDDKAYLFNLEGKRQIPNEILLYAITREKGSDNSLDYDILQRIGLIFCLTDLELISMLLTLQEQLPQYIRYTDTAGLRQVQFLKEIDTKAILNHYYHGIEI